LKHCCLRSMTQVRTIRQPDGDCRWRIWRAYRAGVRQLATGEVAEHVCGGEFNWIARETADGTTWMVDDCPVTLLEVIDEVPPAMAEWVIDQTLAVLGETILGAAGLAVGQEGEIGSTAVDPSVQEERLAEVAGLMREFVQFAHAAAILEERLDSLGELVERARGGEPGGDDERAAA
jgi:hypothetical protein